MPKFAILRELDPNTTRAEIDAEMLRVVTTQLGRLWPDEVFNPELLHVEWIRSYWQPGSNWGMCLYGAPSAARLEDYERKCGDQYVAITEVAELSSPRTTDPETGETALDGGATLFALDATVPEGVAVTASLFENIANLAPPAMAVQFEGAASTVRWIRTYWDEARRKAIALYAAPSVEMVAALDRSLHGSGTIVRPVTELTPREYSAS